MTLLSATAARYFLTFSLKLPVLADWLLLALKFAVIICFPLADGT